MTSQEHFQSVSVRQNSVDRFNGNAKEIKDQQHSKDFLLTKHDKKCCKVKQMDIEKLIFLSVITYTL